MKGGLRAWTHQRNREFSRAAAVVGPPVATYRGATKLISMANDMTTRPHRPPTTSSDEATHEELDFARRQGDAFGAALNYMIRQEAHGREVAAGEYLVGFAVEHAEGLYRWHGDELQWFPPEEENAHIEISIRDGGDGRLLPGLRVLLAVHDSDGRHLGTHEQPFLWHPWIFHYGRNWVLPGDGEYTFRIHIDPPSWPRHDLKNGFRFLRPVDVEFTQVHIETGRKCSREGA